MNRDIAAMANKEFDLAIVGGGIFGACAAWDAALRGLSVAIIERGDFCQATSANQFKIVHGGIRYLQHLDIKRVRESSRERNALLRIAAHLVKPLPTVVPTYGLGLKSKMALAAGFKIYDVVSFDRNKGIRDGSRKVPASTMISKSEVLELFPDLPVDGLTGAGIFYDGQVLNPPRLVLSFVQSAITAGATAANYVEAKRFLLEGGRVNGIEAEDRQTGQRFQIRSRVVLNTAGPWAEKLLDKQAELKLEPRQKFSRDVCFVVRNRLNDTYGLAIPGDTFDPDAVLSREKRHLFITPWREYSLIGVWHKVSGDDPDSISVSRKDLDAFIKEINSTCPQLRLNLNDVVRWNTGLTLFGENKPGAKNLRFGKRSILYDHALENNIEDLLTLIGVRATTARGMAEKAVDIIFTKLGKKTPGSNTAWKPLFGGDIDNHDEFIHRTRQSCTPWLDDDTADALSRNYGSAVSNVLAYLQQDRALAERISSTRVIKAEIVHAVREEMAQNLADVIYRRTELASGAYPGDDALKNCVAIMGDELGWKEDRRAAEVTAAKEQFQGLEQHSADT
jgi:glycerol-3-phosphate dehydrogenase